MTESERTGGRKAWKIELGDEMMRDGIDGDAGEREHTGNRR